MAKAAEQRGLPAQLPVMAALVESNLTNVNFGDADSLGYFQMRVSVWEADYPGFGQDPEKQLDWFLDTAEGVKAQRIARGQPIDDPTQYGEWIADTERPAEQFRGRYQLKLDEANGLLKAAPPAAAPAVAEQAAAAVAPAGAGGAQDAGRRLGRRGDVGAERAAGQQRTQGRQRRRGAARRHRRLRLRRR